MSSAFKLLYFNSNTILQNVHLKSIWPEEYERKKKEERNKQNVLLATLYYTVP
jgi:hypothetical protein